MERSNKDQANKAAWPGSQPLLDSLSHAITELESKTKELKDARDKVKNADITMDKASLGEACGSILAHWTSTLETHRSIFQEVVHVTNHWLKAEPAALFAGFSELSKTADDGIGNAHQLRKSMDAQHGSRAPTSSGKTHTDSKSESNELSDAPEGDRSSSKKRKVGHGGETGPPLSRSPDKSNDDNAEPSADESDEDPIWMRYLNSLGHHYVIQYMANPAIIISPWFVGPIDRKFAAYHGEKAKREMFAEMRSKSEDESAKAAETEDITGLVDDRLEANKVKRKEKKDGKKRKRESTASSIFSPDQDEQGGSSSEDEAEPAKASSKKEELPPKKKAKYMYPHPPKEHHSDSDKETNKEAASKKAREANKRDEEAALGKAADEKKLNLGPRVFDRKEGATAKRQKESDDKGEGVKGKKEKKSKRARSSDGPVDAAEAQDQTRHHSHATRAKKVKTG